MSLNALLLCSDAKIVRVLRRVLGDLDIAVELCAGADSALRKLTRQRFEAILVDCADDGANDVLRSARSAPCNKQAVAVAIVEHIVGLKAVFARRIVPRRPAGPGTRFADLPSPGRPFSPEWCP